MSDPESFCVASSGCSVGQYLSAMKVSVSVNLLAGAWIWLHGLSGEVHKQVYGKVGNIVGVMEKEQGGGDLGAEVAEIVAMAEESIRKISVRGFGTAAAATAVILLVAFFVNHEYIVENVWWWGLAMLLALAGPLAMLVTYISVRRRTAKAEDEAGKLVNDRAGDLRKQKPPIDGSMVEDLRKKRSLALGVDCNGLPRRAATSAPRTRPCALGSTEPGTPLAMSKPTSAFSRSTTKRSGATSQTAPTTY